LDVRAKATEFAAFLRPERRAALANMLGIPEATIMALPMVGYSPRGFHQERFESPCYTFSEVDGVGDIVGIVCRYADGAKPSLPVSHRGLHVPLGWRDRDGPVFLVEGPSDTLAMTAMGLSAIGRASNTGGVDPLAQLLPDVPISRHIVVVGEYDPNDKGRWPGREGAEATAAGLQDKLGRPVQWVLPPRGFKDVRAWANAQNLRMDCLDEWVDAGQRLLSLIIDHFITANPALQPLVAGADLPLETPWPDPPAAEAFYGLAGRIVRAIEPASEADPAALLVQTLVAFGNVIGRGAYFEVEADTSIAC
jgi:hypothetical protein